MKFVELSKDFLGLTFNSAFGYIALNPKSAPATDFFIKKEER